MLLHRQSTALLTTPYPNKEQLENILAAGFRVPDHACLKPFHFTVIKDRGLQKLSDLFFNVAISDNLPELKQEKMKNMPFRAPMIIIVSTKFIEHEKVPKQEQLITAGCSVHAMQMACYTLGYGAIWRTGVLAYHQKIKEGLAIDHDEEIVGFLYIGTPSKNITIKRAISHENHVTYC